MHSNKKMYEEVYAQGGNPWTFKTPPQELAGLIERGEIMPCKALDIGCGEGYYSVYLASRGFQVTGIDWSEKAISLAKKHAEEARVTCRFLVAGWESVMEWEEEFDFVLEGRVLQAVKSLGEREEYVETVSRLLKNGGKYLSVSFSETASLGGEGKIRRTPIGTIIYFASQKELEDLFGAYFTILEKKAVKMPERRWGEVESHYFFMEKR